jgi:signal transduction histidine kinase
MAAGGRTSGTDADGVRLLAEASHELRGGAARLALMAEALAELGLAAGPGDQLANRMRALATEGRRLQALASTLLDLSRLATEGRRLEPVARALAGAVDDVLAGVVPPGRVVHVDVPHEVKVWADPLALDQVLTNLIGNAFQHGGPEVTITGGAAGGHVVVTVADDGAGLPAGWSGSLSSPLLSGIGRGLGLRIAARLATLLDGELRYDAGGTGGARFTLRLPAA